VENSMDMKPRETSSNGFHKGWGKDTSAGRAPCLSHSYCQRNTLFTID
jgi:hypothetical protein